MNAFPGRSSRRLVLLLAALALIALIVIWVGVDDHATQTLLSAFVIGASGLGTLLYRRQQRLLNEAHWDRLTRKCRELPHLGVALLDLDANCWSWNNDALGRLFGADPHHFDWETFISTLAAAERGPARAIYERFSRGECEFMETAHRIHRLDDGSERHIEFDLHALTDIDGRRYMLALAQDVTEQREALDMVSLQRDLYETLSQTNQAIVRATDPQSLFEVICTIAVQHAHIHHAWIGRYEDGRLLPVTSSSADPAGLQSVLEGVDRLDDSVPTRRVLREGKPCVWNRMPFEQMSEVTRRFSRDANIAAVAALPLYQNGQLVGNLTLYSDYENFFSPLVMRTLEEMAGDISYSLANLERQRNLETAHQIIESSPVVGLRWSRSPQRELLFASDNIQRWGYRAADLAGVPLLELIDEADRTRLEHLLRAFDEEELESVSCRFRLRDGRGDARWVEAQVMRHCGDNTPCLEAVVRDVDARKRHEDRLNLAAAVFENTREGVVITDAQQRILEVNRAFTELLGYEPHEVLGQTPKLFSSGRHDSAFYRNMWESLECHAFWEGEIWNRRRDGTLIPELLSISRVDDPDGGERRYVAVFADVTELKRSSEQIEFLAHNDPVTGLPNRTLLLKLLEQALKAGTRARDEVALLMLDLDHFKDINDSFGHAIGDELLQRVASRMRTHLREADTLARLGGDEFAVMVTGLRRHLDAARVAEQLIELLAAPVQLSNGAEIQPGVSIGISLSQHHEAGSAEEMLQKADAALYRAKAQGRGSYAYFSSELTQQAAQRVEMEMRLRRALENGQLEVHYQPQIDIASGRLIGAEALLRWPDPERGLIPPDQFIPLAEQSGLIVALGDWVLTQVCRQGQRWREQGLGDLVLAVNLSPSQLRSEGLVARIVRVLEETGYPPQLLELELTEGAVMHDPETAAELLARLQQSGMRLALDDFGTGYSSLAYLRRFPLDVLKIDKSFIDALPHESEGGAIARTVVAMGHTLGLKVLAEGVEDVLQLEQLRRMGCDAYQGYLCSPALAPDAFAERIKALRDGQQPSAG